MSADHTDTGRDATPGDAPGVDPGVIAGGAHLLRELLRTPRVAKTARILLSHLDPAAAPELVRTVLLQDPVLLLDLLSASPALLNASVLATKEVLRQVGAVPQALSDRFLHGLLADLSAAELGRTSALGALTAVRFLGRRSPALTAALSSFGEEFDRGFRQTLQAEGSSPGGLASSAVSGLLVVAEWGARHAERLADQGATDEAVERLAAGLRRLAQDHPNLMRRIVRPLVDAGREALEG